MSWIDIKGALETRLNAMSPALSTVWENTEIVPVVGTPYQRVYVLPADTQNPTYGDDQKLETGIFQVTLCYPESEGSGAALARAGLIRDQFTRGLTLTQSTTTLRVQNTPSISPGRQEPGLYLIDVSIPFFAYL